MHFKIKLSTLYVICIFFFTACSNNIQNVNSKTFKYYSTVKQKERSEHSDVKIKETSDNIVNNKRTEKKAITTVSKNIITTDDNLEDIQIGKNVIFLNSANKINMKPINME